MYNAYIYIYISDLTKLLFESTANKRHVHVNGPGYETIRTHSESRPRNQASFPPTSIVCDCFMCYNGIHMPIQMVGLCSHGYDLDLQLIRLLCSILAVGFPSSSSKQGWCNSLRLEKRRARHKSHPPKKDTEFCQDEFYGELS